MKLVKHFRDLDVYQNGMALALRIFDLSAQFPPEERYSLTDQIRRSSRSICANIAEAWRKRRYKAAFVSKLNDAETEATETQVWLEFAYRHKYIGKDRFEALDDACDKIVAQLVRMFQEPDRRILPINRSASAPRLHARTHRRTHERK